jgi:hypothetical protein
MTVELSQRTFLRASKRGRFLAMILLCLLLLGWSSGLGIGSDGPPENGKSLPAPAMPARLSAVVSDGEELVYEARWWPFELGQIRINTKVTTLPDGSLHLTAIAHIDSYGNLPFVDLHTVTESEMDSTLCSLDAKSIEKKGDEWWVLSHHFDRASHTLVITDTWQKGKDTPPYKPPTFDTLAVQGQLEDGLSILFYTRSLLHTQSSVRFPTIVYKKLGYTTLHFSGEESAMEIDACDYPIAVKKFTGTAEFEGLFGLSGDFEGWFSNDQAAVPIKAKLGVIVGKIEIELITWKRDGWAPPLGTD